jgi:hypothetical protein
MTSSNLETIRRLALRIAEKAASVENQRVREMWMRHNALQKTAPPVFCRPASPAVREIVHPPVATDPIERRIEELLRSLNLKIDVGDDQVFDPCIWLPAIFEQEGGLFGVSVEQQHASGQGAWRYQPVINTMEELVLCQVYFDGLWGDHPGCPPHTHQTGKMPVLPGKTKLAEHIANL